MKDNKNVRFIRVRGRIVPIRSKKTTKGRDGAASLLAGAGFLGASFVAGKKVISADKMHERAMDFAMDEPFSRLDKKFTEPSSQMFAARKKLKNAGRMKKFSRIIGATFIGLGAERLSEKAGLSDGLGSQFASELVGVSAGVGAESLFRKGAGVKFKDQLKSTGIKVPDAIKRFGRRILKKKFKL